jgi:hypothetical protein
VAAVLDERFLRKATPTFVKLAVLMPTADPDSVSVLLWKPEFAIDAVAPETLTLLVKLSLLSE